jgi:hypothetical protein
MHSARLRLRAGTGFPAAPPQPDSPPAGSAARVCGNRPHCCGPVQRAVDLTARFLNPSRLASCCADARALLASRPIFHQVRSGHGSTSYQLRPRVLSFATFARLASLCNKVAECPNGNSETSSKALELREELLAFSRWIVPH